MSKLMFSLLLVANNQPKLKISNNIKTEYCLKYNSIFV